MSNIIITENKILPVFFNPKIYKKLNIDLQHLSEEEAIYHYKTYGFNEGRKYDIGTIPNDFNVTIYKKLYYDLQHLSDEDAICHYKTYGFYEGRIYINPQHKVIFDNIKPFSNPSDISMFLSKRVVKYSKNSSIKANELIQNLPRCQHNSKEKINSKLLSSFLLIIDFNNLGGGTSIFIESIISRYKKNKTFLIARNFNGQIFFTVNDDYELEKSYNQNDAYLFLLNNKNKIEKIFINHTLNHSKEFLDNLFKLEKKITTITHDFSNIFNEPQIIFNDMEKYILDLNKRSKVNINSYDQIITQNSSNLYIYDKFIENKKKIIITPLPDFKNSKDLIKTANNNIIIGIIGGINDIKGKKELGQLINLYKNSNIRIIVFGKTHIDSFIDYYPYNNIYELNNLLIIHKPNILIELSIWHETYSYTLTISMLTQLPILYLKKNGYSTIENRLSKYDKAYSFETIYEFNDLVYGKKQNYFYTIEPAIYFNEIWDNYFLSIYNKSELSTINNDYIGKNIILITSKIIVSNISFSYTKNRSIYTKETRFIQTINTIESIRKYIPNSYIVLVDNSELNQIECHILKKLTNYFINITDDKELNYNTNENKIKMFGDISQQLCFYHTFLKNINTSKVCNFFKISGRYLVNRTFDYSEYNNDFNIFKKNEKVLDRDYYFTSFYKLNPNKLIDYFYNLNHIIDNKDIYNENTIHDIEVIIPSKIKNKKLISNLGITQIFSVWNVIDNI